MSEEVKRRVPPGSVSVIVPALNEAGNIDLLLEGIFACARGSAPGLEVIVVDDGSTDGTRELVRNWARSHPVRLLTRDQERGLAGAVLAGAAAASGEVVVVMDADLSHPPDKIGELVRPILEGTSDLVIGSRYVSGGSTPGWPLSRRLASRAAAALAWPLVEVRDPLSGFFAVGRERLLEAGGQAVGFKIGLEVLLRGGDGLRVQEVPIRFRDRASGTSKL